MILAINTGSSSLKLGLFEDDRAVFDVSVEDVGRAHGALTIRDGSGEKVREAQVTASNHREAYGSAVAQLAEFTREKPDAVGHRVVHGGPKLTQHQRITPEVVQQLREAVHFAPLHIPASLELIEETEKQYPGVPQFACFDTAFHATIPESAAHFALPQELWEAGVRRYGFHGLSCESVVRRFGGSVPERLIVAHLGSGASVTAILRAASVDTSMGLTPTGGVVMSSRSGDLDPGVATFLMRTRGMTSDELEALLNRESGLFGLSGMTGMKEIEAAISKGDVRAQLAFEIFCRQIAKFVAGFATVLGGMDVLVFTGGIGEHSEGVRESVCERLKCLGRSEMRVMPSEEDVQIARHCRELLKG